MVNHSVVMAATGHSEHEANAGLMSGQCRWFWSNNKPSFDLHIVFTCPQGWYA